MIALRFKTSLARSIARVAAQPTTVSSIPALKVGEQPAELGDFARSDHVAPTSPPAGIIPQWLQKIVERFPVERLQRRLSSPDRSDRPASLSREAEQSAPLGDELDLAIAELERELELRAGLIREHWAIRGPGLLAALARQSGFQHEGGELEVELVLPLTGGAAGVDELGKPWMEALLHDVSFQFPETLRVGWLVARLGSLNVDAAVSLLLNAAAEVDWLSADPATEADLRNWLGIGAAKSVNKPTSGVAPGGAA